VRWLSFEKAKEEVLTTFYLRLKVSHYRYTMVL
jgi:hypothetical protein